jgi:hypothetical protein
MLVKIKRSPFEMNQTIFGDISLPSTVIICGWSSPSPKVDGAARGMREGKASKGEIDLAAWCG